MTILQLIESYVNGKTMPERVKYSMMQDGYEYFKWDKDDEEYRCETDRDCYLSQVPWHHLLDEIEVVVEKNCKTCEHSLWKKAPEDCDRCVVVDGTPSKWEARAKYFNEDDKPAYNARRRGEPWRL